MMVRGSKVLASSERPSQDEINRRLLSTDHLQQGLGQKTVRGGAIAAGGQVLRLVLQIGTTAIMARLLAPEDFGLVAMAMTVMAFVAVFTEVSVTAATIQRDNLDQDTASAILLINIAATLTTLALASIFSPVAQMVFGDERLPPLVIGLAAAIPIQALGSQHYALLSRNMKWIDSHMASLGAFTVGCATGVLAAWLGAGYWSLIYQLWTTAITGSAIAWLRCPWRPSWVKDWSGAKASLHFGLNLTGAAIMNFFQRQVDIGLIGWRWGATELGFYTRAYNLLQTPLTFISGPITLALIPALSRLQNDPVRWRAAYLDCLAAVSVLGAGMAAILFGGAAPIIDLVFGHGWAPSQVIFSHLAVGMLAATPMTATTWIYISLGRTQRMFFWSLIVTPVYVAAFLIGVSHGADGVALCFAGAQLLMFLPCLWMATRKTSVTLIDTLLVILPPTAAAVATAAALRLATARLGPVQDFVAIAFAGLLFIGLMAPVFWLAPNYRRLKELGLKTFDAARQRLLPRQASAS